MNITFAGDWHGVTYQALNAVSAAKENGSQYIFHLGDFGIWKTADRYLKGLNNALKKENIILYFVEGNHEDFQRLYAYPIGEDGTRKIRSNIYHLPRGHRFTLEDTDDQGHYSVSFMAFGGAYSVDRPHRRLNESFWLEELATPDEIQAAATSGPVDVLLMHDCPAPLPNRITDDPASQIRGIHSFGHNQIQQATAYRKHLTPLLDTTPSHVFHGHYHTRSNYIYTYPEEGRGRGRARVVCLDEGNGGTLKNTMHTTLRDLATDRDNLRGEEPK